MTAKPYRVGRGRPPVHTQWAPKTSGNPGGRPEGRRLDLPYESVLGQILEMDGQKATAEHAFLKGISNRDLSGRAPWSKRFHKLLAEFRKAQEPIGRARTIIHTVYANLGDIGMLMRRLNMATLYYQFLPTAALMLEPWIVEAALGRLGGRRLTLAEQEVVFASTRTPHKVRWPDWWTMSVAD